MLKSLATALDKVDTDCYGLVVLMITQYKGKENWTTRDYMFEEVYLKNKKKQQEDAERFKNPSTCHNNVKKRYKTAVKNSMDEYDSICTNF